MKLGGRVPESEAWIKGAGKRSLDGGRRKLRLGVWALESKV